ncbi:hypothetical protein EDE15_3154 [Edaphobacter aggregans]|uniref:UPF0235 protein EDE15_3154 n=1 Tax=Edaphobacter aggregans TaxID=570835 RepID=A0A428MLB1_9BACT|nr:DUF167 domain-containing protein [Edaphobacter aggregans]RSL17619.1 hypothetical protein EDE15_3154 [Edaphobacter aggregans]
MDDAADFVQDVGDGCTVSVRVHPGARKNGVSGVHAGAVKISLTTPPVDGRANDALIAFVAELLRVPRGGESCERHDEPSKVLRITGKSAAEVRAALLPVDLC